LIRAEIPSPSFVRGLVDEEVVPGVKVVLGKGLTSSIA